MNARKTILTNTLKNNVMTTKELAEQLNTRPNVITENTKKCLPNKRIENGKPTYYTKEEVTVLLEFMKSNNNRTDLDLSDRLIGLTTDLTPALKIKKAMELMQEGYEEELAILKTENNKQKALLIEQQPKVDFYDDVTGSKDTIDMKEVAKILNIKNVGRNKLFEILRNKNILDHRNQPYQKYVDAGYFRVIESRFNLPDGEIKISLKTVVFQRGLDFIRREINKKNA